VNTTCGMTNTRSTLLLMLLSLAMGYVGGQLRQLSPQHVVSAQRFEIVDKQGNLRGVFGVSNSNTVSLSMSNDKHLPSVSLSDQGFFLSDAAGRLRAMIDISEKETQFTLWNPTGKNSGKSVFRVP